MTVTFYNVKKKKQVSIEEGNIEKVTYERIYKNGSKSTL